MVSPPMSETLYSAARSKNPFANAASQAWSTSGSVSASIAQYGIAPIAAMSERFTASALWPRCSRVHVREEVRARDQRVGGDREVHAVGHVAAARSRRPRPARLGRGAREVPRDEVEFGSRCCCHDAVLRGLPSLAPPLRRGAPPPRAFRARRSRTCGRRCRRSVLPSSMASLIVTLDRGSRACAPAPRRRCSRIARSIGAHLVPLAVDERLDPRAQRLGLADRARELGLEERAVGRSKPSSSERFFSTCAASSPVNCHW